jgi:hypothetical protein
MLNRRMMIITALAAVLFCTTINDDAYAAPFQPGDFITWSQDEWGSQNTAASQLLLNHFFEVYPNGVEIGIPGAAGFSAIFSTGEAILDYLPATGDPAPLDNDLLDPPGSTPSGAFGGYVLALQLDVDFSAAGLLAGSAGIPYGDLILFNMLLNFGGGPVDMSALNGLSVFRFLGLVNTQLGGGGGPYSDDNMAFVTNALGLAFVNGQPTQFAQEHLQVPNGVPQPVPEPATLGLLAFGLGALTVRRFKGLRRQALRRFGVIGPLSLSVKVDTNPCG